MSSIIVRDIPQGSDEWILMKRGVVSASNFGKIMGSTGKVSTSRDKYMWKLLAEQMGDNMPNYTNAAMEEGTLNEEHARNWYEFEHDADVEEVSFVYMDDTKRVGCSPDGLVDDGGVEIKCPQADTHTGYLLGTDKIPAIYIPQVYGSMYVTGRSYWHFISYREKQPTFFVEATTSDPAYIKWIKAFEPALQEFLEDMDKSAIKLNKRK